MLLTKGGRRKHKVLRSGLFEALAVKLSGINSMYETMCKQVYMTYVY